MGAPTFVAAYGAAGISTTTPKTASITTAVGDMLVAYAGSSNTSMTWSTPTGGTGLTWIQRQVVSAVTGRNSAAVWVATASTAQTFTFSLAVSSGSGSYDFQVLRFSNTGGVGNTAKDTTVPLTGAPSVSFTTAASSSAVVMFINDFNGVSPAGHTYLTSAGAFTEEMAGETVSGSLTLYGGFYFTGTAGTGTYGMSAPTGQTPTTLLVEVEGSGTSDSATVSAAGVGAASVGSASGFGLDPFGTSPYGLNGGLGSDPFGTSPFGLGGPRAPFVTVLGTAVAAGAGTVQLLVLTTGTDVAAGTGTGTVSGRLTKLGALSPAGTGAATVGGLATHPSGALAASGAGRAAVTGTVGFVAPAHIPGAAQILSNGICDATVLAVAPGLATLASDGTFTAGLASDGTGTAAVLAVAPGTATVNTT